MTATKYEQIWHSLEDEEYRREFNADVDTGLAFQIRALREKNGWTQGELAERAGSDQGTISQWENPNYGRYTLKTLKSLANAFDVGLLVRFAPFSELALWASLLIASTKRTHHTSCLQRARLSRRDGFLRPPRQLVNHSRPLLR
jgi:transcriptional regulator with XRE-family HTH domain